MRLLSIGRTKLHELVASGDLPMWKLGGERRITRAALEAFILRRANGEGRATSQRGRGKNR